MMKTMVKIGLIRCMVFILVAVTFASCSNQAATTSPSSGITPPPTSSSAPSIAVSGPPDRVETNYFYQKDVCPCLSLANQLVNDTVSNDYKAQLNSGKLTFKTFDSDDPANAGVIAQFEAPKFAFFITTVRGTLRTTKNIGGLWVYISQTSAQQDKFVALLKKEVDKALAGN
jgi:hypothetical protein